MTLVKADNFISDGFTGEITFRKWLDEQDIGYLYISQEQYYYAKAFKGNTKRPDFLMSLPSLGFISVDVKHHSIQQYDGEDCFTLNIRNEVEKAVNFEDVSNLPLWYAYFPKNSEERNRPSCWYFISARKALSEGVVRTKTNDPYLSIELEHFTCVEESQDLSPLLDFKFKNKLCLKDLAIKIHEELKISKQESIHNKEYSC